MWLRVRPGTDDKVIPPEAVASLVAKLKTQRGIRIEHKVIEGANHFFNDRIDELADICGSYLDERLKAEA